MSTLTEPKLAPSDALIRSLDEQSHKEVIYSPLVQNALDELYALSLLEEDWDAYDAPPISREALHAASVLLKQSAKIAHAQNLVWVLPDVAPTPSGGVYLHWAGDTQPYSVITDSSPEAVTLLVGMKNQRAERFVLSVDEALKAIVRCMRDDAQSLVRPAA